MWGGLSKKLRREQEQLQQGRLEQEVGSRSIRVGALQAPQLPTSTPCDPAALLPAAPLPPAPLLLSSPLMRIWYLLAAEEGSRADLRRKRQL